LLYGKCGAEPVNILVPSSLYYLPWTNLLLISRTLYK